MRATNEKTAKHLIVAMALIAPLPVVAFVLTRMFVLDWSVVRSSSMEPALPKNHLVFFQKFGFDPLQRDDIVVFHRPDTTEAYVKRVVGLPGDIVRVSKGDASELSIETADGATLYVEDVDAEDTDEQATPVPSSMIYVLGDNHANSIDSRNFGPVPIADVIGKVIH